VTRFPSTESFVSLYAAVCRPHLVLGFVACVFNLPVAQEEGDRNNHNLYGLFDDAFSNSGYIASRIVWLEKVLKGTVVALVNYHIFLRNVCVREAAGDVGRDSPRHWFIARRDFSPSSVTLYGCR